MKTLLKWFWMLNKRLYKKPTFLAIMAAIPLCVLALTFAAQQQGGFLRIVLAQGDPADPISSQIVGELLAERSLIQFTQAPNPEAALEAVHTGQADVAWIFPADMAGQLERFINNKTRHNAVVRVVERETTVFSRLTQEKLTSTMFAVCAKAEYLQFIRESTDLADKMTEEEMLQAYQDMAISEELFTFENAEGTLQGGGSGNYMTAPVRGLLAVLICLCAAAATVYHMQDEQLGTFSLVREHLRPAVAFACIMIAVLNIGVMASLALAASGLLNAPWREIGVMLLYGICCAGFWLMVKEILSDIKWLCGLLPILVIAMVAICPVFFQLGMLNGISHLLPPTYYIRAAHDLGYLGWMALYALGTLAIAAGLQWCKAKRRRK